MKGLYTEFGVNSTGGTAERLLVVLFSPRHSLLLGTHRWLIELAPHFYQFRGAPGHAGAAPRLGTKRRLGPERPVLHAQQDGDERAT